MREPGALLASGRDSDIFEYGDGLVLRRARSGRSMELEARTMEYARAHGYPVPAVAELSADGSDLVMERVEGPSTTHAAATATRTSRSPGSCSGPPRSPSAACRPRSSGGAVSSSSAAC